MIRRWRVPEVHQAQQTECGAACLAMVLGFHGRPVSLRSVREVMPIGRDGADANTILAAARAFGLRGRGVSLDIDELDTLPAGAILYWGFQHFVVFEGIGAEGVDLVDPACGRRRVSMERFRRSFTGVALLFEVVADYRPPPVEPSLYWGQLRRSLAQPVPVTRVLVVSVLLRAVALVFPAVTGFVIDRVVPRGDDGTLLVVVGAVGGLAAFQATAAVLRGHLLLALRTRVDLQTTLGFLDHLLSLPYDFFQQRSTGDLLMRVNSHSTIRELLTTAAISALLDGPFVVIGIIVLLVASPGMCALVVGLALAHLGVLTVGRRQTRDVAAAELDARSVAQGELVQIIAGAESLKAHGAEQLAGDRWAGRFVDELNASYRRGSTAVLLDGARIALRSLGPLAVLGAGAVAVMHGGLSLGAMLGLAGVAASVLEPIDALVDHALQLNALARHVERIDDVLRCEPERPPHAAARPVALEGQIRLSGVTFRYPGASAPVVDGVDLEVPAGSSVAIVGPSGSGKSTLAKLLLGLHRPSAGAVAFDGIALDALDLRAVRRQVGLVLQKPHLFSGSIRRNIALGSPGVPLDAVRAAAELAEIRQVIESMPMSWETHVGEDGDALSGGERQRIALARALVGKPRILLLDEATSALDTETEARIMDNLARLRCTRVIIAHRLSTIAAADTILVVDGGRIVERGTHAELLRRRGRYLSLVEAQT